MFDGRPPPGVGAAVLAAVAIVLAAVAVGFVLGRML